MEREDFKIIVKGLKAVYAQPTFIADADAFDVWLGMLQDLPYKLVNLAAQKHMAESPYPPTISDIRKMCTKISHGTLPDVDDAWGMVLKAIRSYGYMREAEALESLPEPCRSVVKNMGWQNLCQSENIMAERAFFRDSYRPKMEAAKEEMIIPAQIRQESRELLNESISRAAAALTLGGDKHDTGAGSGGIGTLQD